MKLRFVSIFINICIASTLSFSQESSQEINVVPGKSLGPIQIGIKKDAFEKLGLPIDKSEKATTSEFITSGFYSIHFEDGSITDIWIDNIRIIEPSLIYMNKKVPKNIPPEKIKTFFKKCTTPEHRIGGTLVRCEQGGLTLVYYQFFQI